VIFGNLAILCFAGDKRSCDLFEGIVKLVVVEKDPVVIVLAIEAIFDLADGASDFPNIRIPGEGDKSGVHARAIADRRRQGSGRVGGGFWGISFDRLLIARCRWLGGGLSRGIYEPDENETLERGKKTKDKQDMATRSIPKRRL